MSKERAIGESLSPILTEIEETLWEHEANCGLKPNFTNDGFKAGCKIFMSALLDKMFEKQQRDGATQEAAMKEAELIGYEVRALIVKATGLDPHEFYNTNNSVIN